MKHPVGKSFSTYEPYRDAIHVPVIKARVNFDAYPCDVVELQYREDTKEYWAAPPKVLRKVKYIIDPFLKKGVPRGDTVLIFVAPGEASDVHHYWTNEDIPQ